MEWSMVVKLYCFGVLLYGARLILGLTRTWCKCMQLEVFRRTLMQSLKEDDDNFVSYCFSLGLMNRVWYSACDYRGII